jgi:hypothetical protein
MASRERAGKDSISRKNILAELVPDFAALLKLGDPAR